MFLLGYNNIDMLLPLDIDNKIRIRGIFVANTLFFNWIMFVLKYI